MFLSWLSLIQIHNNSFHKHRRKTLVQWVRDIGWVCGVRSASSTLWHGWLKVGLLLLPLSWLVIEEVGKQPKKRRQSAEKPNFLLPSTSSPSMFFCCYLLASLTFQFFGCFYFPESEEDSDDDFDRVGKMVSDLIKVLVWVWFPLSFVFLL